MVFSTGDGGRVGHLAGFEGAADLPLVSGSDPWPDVQAIEEAFRAMERRPTVSELKGYHGEIRPVNLPWKIVSAQIQFLGEQLQAGKPMIRLRA
jgi:hypothetical protein